MPKLIIVENPDNWKFNLEDAEVVTPSAYISGDDYKDSRGLKVINLCKSYQYQSMGYYVSLLAEARKHKVLPGVTTIQDLRFPSILREDSQEDRKSTRLNSSHSQISYAVFCLKKKK